MKFPSYWAKSNPRTIEVRTKQMLISCWRWSWDSLADAQRLAATAAEDLAAKAHSGAVPNHYGYADRPMREPVLRQMQNGAGTLSAAITRNSYGCQVLNTAQAMFLDVDFPEVSEKPGFLASLFGAKPAKPDNATALLKVAARWIHEHPDWGLRVYRTKAGARLLVTHDVFDPGFVAGNPVWATRWGVDPLYLRLCQAQQCFRARLTPKPWRCQAGLPPARWPFEDPRVEQQFKAWLQQYESASRFHSTCRLLETLGSTRVHPEVEPVMHLHDEATGAHGSLPLA